MLSKTSGVALDARLEVVIIIVPPRLVIEEIEDDITEDDTIGEEVKELTEELAKSEDDETIDEMIDETTGDETIDEEETTTASTLPIPIATAWLPIASVAVAVT